MNDNELFADEHPPYELEQRDPGKTPVRHLGGLQTLHRAGVIPATVARWPLV